jgi:transcription initiation factor TFIIIB Brf1 subunit/transcription initiation factor TFIIB
VYFTDEQVENSPSRKDGVPQHIERRLRIFGCEIIQDAGILLKLPQVTMATAQVLFHRFYCKQSLKRYNVKQVAMASLFLASKIEEVPKRARDVLNVFHHIEQVKTQKKIEPLNFTKQKYWEMKKDLIKTERFMLKEMGFSTYVEHPHKFLLSYLDVLNKSDNVELAQVAWNYMNDSLREPLCVRFRPEVIASACIYMAAYKLKIALPESPHAWWEIFDAKQEQLDEIAYIINLLYKEPEVKYMSLNRSNHNNNSVKEKKSEEKKSRKRSLSPSNSPSRSRSPAPPSSLGHTSSDLSKNTETTNPPLSTNGSDNTESMIRIPLPRESSTGNMNTSDSQSTRTTTTTTTTTSAVVRMSLVTSSDRKVMNNSSSNGSTATRKSTRRTVIQGAPETRVSTKKRPRQSSNRSQPYSHQ